jgi:hypothetical protein
MHLSLPPQIRTPYLLILLIFLTSSCIETPTPEVQKQVVQLYQVDNIGESIAAGSDSLFVEEFKFIVSDFSLLAEDSTLIQTSDQVGSIVFTYNKEMIGEVLILSAPLGFIDINFFIRYSVLVDQAELSDILPDQDFYGSSQNYSLVTSGRFNGNPFVHRSAIAFEKEFELNNIQLGTTSPSLVLRKKLDIEDVFTDPDSGNLLNPARTSDREKIDSLFRTKLQIEASAEDIL